MSRPQIYLAHPMRGKLGSKGNGEYGYQNANSKIAVENVKWLRVVFPEVDWYCPGEVEIPVQMFHKLGFVTDDQILYMDKCVLKELCHGVLAHRWEDSEGVDGEIVKGLELKYPVVTINKSPYIRYCNINTIRTLVDAVIEHYKNAETKE